MHLSGNFLLVSLRSKLVIFKFRISEIVNYCNLFVIIFSVSFFCHCFEQFDVDHTMFYIIKCGLSDSINVSYFR